MTLTPATGTPIKVVSGFLGMFFIGTISDTITPTPLSAPYTACISKCPLTVCSTTNGHTTTDDCVTCHDGSTTSKVYLK